MAAFRGQNRRGSGSAVTPLSPYAVCSRTRRSARQTLGMRATGPASAGADGVPLPLDIVGPLLRWFDK